MTFYERVYKAVALIPKGKVATYGQIALLAGSPRASRVVGYALHVNPMPGVIPCPRVVNREGRLLEGEGVVVEDGFVNLKRYCWDSSLIRLDLEESSGGK